MPNILILSCVVGGGHVFRDIAITSELKKIIPPEYNFIFATGGHAYQMFKDEGIEVEKIEGVEFPTNLGTIDFMKFYFTLMRSELIQLFQLRKLVNKYQPEIILLDEFYFLTDYCKFRKIPVVFMCDFIGIPKSSFLKTPFRFGLETFFDWFLASYLPKRADRWIYIGDPDHIPREEWLSRLSGNGITPVEPITKVQYSETPSRELARKELGFGNEEFVVTVTVGCSGTGAYILNAVNEAALSLQKSISNLKVELICGYGITPEKIGFLPGKNVSIHGYVKNIEYFYAASDLMIIQSGITTATECLMIGAPMIVIPITNHWEQEHTASYLKKKAGTTIINGKDVSANVIADAILKQSQKNHKKASYFKGDGHKAAAKAISELL
jgi:UDP-N-acetylglucosamine:LPS N-acetylglucosamine transferase